MSKLIRYGLLVALIVQLPSFAAETEVVAEGQVTQHEEASRDTHWDFITCVHTTHECYDEAWHHGYQHYKAVHDHHKCPGHADLACYGGHH